jgi:hypothetical protein
VGSEVARTCSRRSRCSERDGLEDERKGQDHVPDQEVPGRLRPDEFLDAAGNGDRGARHEQPDRSEQRPDVGLPAVTERVGDVRRAAGPPVGNQQEDLVARIGPGMRGLSQQRRRPGERGGGRLRHGDEHVDRERDQDRDQAL